VLDVTVIYLLTGRLDVALGFMIISNVYTSVAYYFHERLWNKIGWGKKMQEQLSTRSQH
jgi:adenylylsulfate kinase